MDIDEHAKIAAVANVLDCLLGDTDPDCGDMTDEEIKTEYPLFWACRELYCMREKKDWDDWNKLIRKPNAEVPCWVA